MRFRKLITPMAVLLLAALCFGCGLGKPAGKPVPLRNVEAVRSAQCRGVAWTGRELVLWSWLGGLAYDPERNVWRDIARNPNVENDVSCIDMVASRPGEIVSAYRLGQGDGLRFDRYLTDANRWETLARVPFETLRNIDEPGGHWADLDRPNSYDGKALCSLRLGSVTRLDDACIAFVSSNWDSAKAIGVRVADNGAVSFIARVNAPKAVYSAPVVYVRNGRLLYWGYSHVAENQGAVWTEKTDTWTKPGEADARYSFASCLAGDDVYIFGGAYSSAYGWILHDGWVYSFPNNSWRPMPLAGGPKGRRDHMMCWTGKEVLVWGGDTHPRLGKTEAPADRRFDSGAAFNPKTSTWRGMSTKGEPSPRSSCFCVWTGREMLLWGGYRSGANGAEYLFEGFAYNPETDSWRRLPDPKPLP